MSLDLVAVLLKKKKKIKTYAEGDRILVLVLF